ncbi:hypothetical protein BDZ89DRAFT_1157071 [Hymenopellis radicata]|nr:hypothetical protein BDZ89DRAFT_1157071 [Hymenopellis radicata]
MFQGFHPPSSVERFPLRGGSHKLSRRQASTTAMVMTFPNPPSPLIILHMDRKVKVSMTSTPPSFLSTLRTAFNLMALNSSASDSITTMMNTPSTLLVEAKPTAMLTASQASAAGYDFPASQACDFSMLSTSNAGTFSGDTSMPASQASDFSMMSSTGADLPDLPPITRAELQAAMCDFAAARSPRLSRTLSLSVSATSMARWKACALIFGGCRNG